MAEPMEGLEPPVLPGLGRLNPVLKLVLVLCVALLAVTLDQLASLGLLTVFSLSMVLGSGLRPRQLRPLLVLALAATWGTLMSQGLFYDRQPRTLLVTLVPALGGTPTQPWFPGLFLYREGVLHGLVQSLRFLSLLLLGASVSLTTSPERLFQGLKALRVPYGLSFMAVTAVRFLPLALQELQTVRAVRALRGHQPWRSGLREALRSEVAMLQPVLVKTLRRATDLATALTLRAFDPVRPETDRAPLSLTMGERVGLGSALLVTGGLVVLKGLYLLYLHQLLYIPGFRELYGWIRQWV